VWHVIEDEAETREIGIHVEEGNYLKEMNVSDGNAKNNLGYLTYSQSECCSVFISLNVFGEIPENATNDTIILILKPFRSHLQIWFSTTPS
jgi:hypothetical protein